MSKILKSVNFWKILLFLASIFLFILAIYLMKSGAKSLTPIIRDWLSVDNVFNGLGFGWLSAYVVMSGSPVAAASLTFLDAGAIDKFSAFATIIGSRFGASFIVLFLGFIYVLRGRNRTISLSMGFLSLTVTQITYLVGMVIGIILLKLDLIGGWRASDPGAMISGVDHVFQPLVAMANDHLPTWLIFLLGLGIIVLSFKLFDICIPKTRLKKSEMGNLARLIFKPWVMFLAGGLITIITLSVSVSLGLLVPLSQRGYIRRENVIPYILGANITTLADTFFAALLLGEPAAVSIVVVGMLSITIVSVILLLVGYSFFNRNLLRLVDLVTKNNKNMAIYLATILVIPILLMMV